MEKNAPGKMSIIYNGSLKKIKNKNLVKKPQILINNYSIIVYAGNIELHQGLF